MSITGDPSCASSSVTSRTPSPVVSFTRTPTMRATVAPMKFGRLLAPRREHPANRVGRIVSWMQLQLVARLDGPVQSEQRQDLIAGLQTHQTVRERPETPLSLMVRSASRPTARNP